MPHSVIHSKPLAQQEVLANPFEYQFFDPA